MIDTFILKRYDVETIFKKFDHNKDFITKKGFTRICKRYLKNPTEDNISEAFEIIDVNGSNRIKFGEFRQAFKIIESSKPSSRREYNT